MELSHNALITGAGRGIGRTVALGLASRGWNVNLIARSRDELDGVQKEIADLGGEVLCKVLPTDVANLSEVEKAVAQVSEAGPIGLVVNNAGIYAEGSAELKPEEFEGLIKVNVQGSWNIVHTVVPLMKQRGRGYIFNVSSICGLTTFPGVGAYCSSKFALRGLSLALTKELAPEGISVCAICPSWVDTQMASHCPFEREKMIRPDDILKAIEFVMSLSPGACIPELVVQCTSDLI